ncbi:hypothetical protein HV077_07925 [Citrobacter freundii]|uniref:Uncharacterized protein n=1 Tax=Citrobacter freundii TaxID=546 RepID=A0A7W3D3Q9_CITFR|nr:MULTISPECIES: hypothetical protein [Citrobacter]EKN6166710.1 hypothetical protein [Yersinia enterocolitica]EKN6394968.1 hypothetical protein [Yersinia enterocolitica]EKN6408452.1 hypothetical protein [Yersinia enterocolitica]ELY5222442.1 hypothetical protein [Yersinia enterocolitica]MBA8062323.1 hypothetical protein [Citrobacter freundii]
MGGVILVNLVLVVCAFWVFVDAANNKIGVHTITEGVSKGYKSGISPVVWGVGSLFILPFIIYMARRKSLIERAKSNPVDTDKNTGFIILFLILAGLIMFTYRDVLFS